MNTLAAIVGLSAGWIALAALASAAAVLAHLIARRALPKIEFPIARFLSSADPRAGRPRRLRDALLIATRALLIAFLALAFDRPAWTTAVPTPLERTNLVVVLDASASMTREDRGGAFFEQARRHAREAVQSHVERGGLVGVVLARRSPAPLLPTLTDRPAPLLDALESARVTLERADLGAAIERARALPALEGAASAPRRLLVVTDAQRSHWESLARLDRSDRAAIEIAVVGSRPPMANLALFDPRMRRRGERVEISATVWNSGPDPVETIVTLETAEQSRRRALRLAPDARAGVSFEAPPAAELARLSLPPDRFPHDDAIEIPIDAAPQRRVAVVAPADDWMNRWSAAPYVAAALDLDGESPLTLARLAPVDLPAAALDGFSAIVLTSDPPLDDAAWSALRRAVEDGGRLILASAPDVLARLGARSRIELAPTETLFRPKVDRALETLLGPDAPSLERARFQRRLRIEETAPWRAAAQFEDDVPLLIERSLGEGIVQALLAPIDPGSSSLVRSPAFPALIHALVRADSQASLPVFDVGEPIALAIAPAVAPPLTDSLGRRVALSGVADARAALVEAVDEPGIVAVRDGAGDLIARAVVTLDPRESDMARAADEQIASVVGAAQPDRADAAVARTESRSTRIELWPFLLMLAGALAALEALLTSAGRRVAIRTQAPRHGAPA